MAISESVKNLDTDMIIDHSSVIKLFLPASDSYKLQLKQND